MNLITYQHANKSLRLSSRYFCHFHQQSRIIKRQWSCNRHHHRWHATQTVSTKALSFSSLKLEAVRTCTRMASTKCNYSSGGIRSGSSWSNIGTRNSWNNSIMLFQHDLHCNNYFRRIKLLLFSSSSSQSKNSSNSNIGGRKKRPSFGIPKKAPVNLTPKARQFFKALLQNKIQNNNDSINNDKNDAEEIVGILLQYQQSKTGEPRMVFTFDFVTQSQLGKKDEPVSLEVVRIATDSDADVDTNIDANTHIAKEENYKTDQGKEEIPKSPEESYNDGLSKLYIHEHAFMKVLGCTIDMDLETFTPILYDREGNVMDPNA